MPSPAGSIDLTETPYRVSTLGHSPGAVGLPGVPIADAEGVEVVIFRVGISVLTPNRRGGSLVSRAAGSLK